MTRTRRLLGVAALAAALTSCGPPSLDSYGAKGLEQDIRLGAQSSPTPLAPPQTADLLPGTPGIFIPPFSGGGFSFSFPTPEACPPAGPLAVNDGAAASNVTSAPKPGTYLYHQSGYFQYKGKPKILFPPETKIIVTKSYVGRLLANGVHDPSDSDIYWDQLELTYNSSGGVVEDDTTYQLVPGVVAGPQQAVTNEINIYEQQLIEPDGTHYTTFQPSGPNPAEYAIFPAVAEPQWNDNAEDAINQVQYSDNVMTASTENVDACGKLVNAYKYTFGNTTQAINRQYEPPQGCPGVGNVFVCFTPGAVTVAPLPPSNNLATFTFANQPQYSYEIDGSYDLATQLGGLLVSENITETSNDCTVAPAPVASTATPPQCGTTGSPWTIQRSMTIDSVTPQ